jgi:predicted lipid-binding transport protein (Tim44 family)|tara:strand:+ start:1926 stop:2519 length:594 start_codon:yes stop_codon:yes gene_type:complete
MNYSFEYIDILLLAMIAGFIFLRLRGILGKRTGYDGKVIREFQKEFTKNTIKEKIQAQVFDDKAQEEFLVGAKIAYETIITDFSDSDNKLTTSKPLLSKKIFDQFKDALIERDSQSHFAEITFIGINSAFIKKHEEVNNRLEVTVDFISELITCVRDKNKKVISGDSEKVKKVYDTWKFSKDIRSANPNWLLIDTAT